MERHTHKYIRIKIGKNKRIEFKCALPGCVHHIKPELAEGRMSICNICSREFCLTSDAMKLAKPHCITCKRGSNVSSIIELLNREA